MRIGKWAVRIKGWRLVFEPHWAKRVGESTFDGRHKWVNAGPMTWEDLSAYYSAEDIKRWKESLGEYLCGVSACRITPPAKD